MNTQITHDIRVSVNIFYQDQYSQPQNDKFFFAYKVRIENNSAETVQLLSRRWQIFDSNNISRKVEGEGVVGEQPVLNPGDAHEYVSWCNLKTEMGKMEGSYLMQKKDNRRFRVRIPEFHLIAAYRLN